MKTKTRRRRWLITSLLLWLAAGSLAQAFYNPGTGRWLNRDPLEGVGFRLHGKLNMSSVADGENLHAFVANRSVNAIDPMGLWCITITVCHITSTSLSVKGLTCTHSCTEDKANDILQGGAPTCPTPLPFTWTATTGPAFLCVCPLLFIYPSYY